MVLVMLPCFGQRRREVKQTVKLEVLKVEKSATASQNDDLYHLKVRLTNEGRRPVAYTNNRFVLTDDKGQFHLVSRPWYPQGGMLEVGKSAEFDRVYFEVPKGNKPVSLNLMWGRIPIGEAKI